MSWWEFALYLGFFVILLGVGIFAVWVATRPRPAGGWRDNGEGE